MVVRFCVLALETLCGNFVILALETLCGNSMNKI
jgi:hypothetical protein